MTELDQYVRRAMLRHPLIFPDRGSVLAHTFACNGNGLYWIDGRPDDGRDQDHDEAALRAAFFEDLDERIAGREELREGLPKEIFHSFDAKDRIERAKRQFQLDHLDDLAISGCVSGTRHGAEWLRGYYRPGWLAMNIPEDAEESFRKGAIETLRDILCDLRGAQLEDHPIFDEIRDEYHRHTPKDADLAARIDRILGRKEPEPEEDPVTLSRFQRQKSSGCIEMEVEDFIALTKAEDGTLIDWDDFLNVQMEGKSMAGIPGIDGIHSVDYNGHFGAAIHYTVETENDMPTTHAAVARMIKSQVRKARALLAAEQEEDEVS